MLHRVAIALHNRPGERARIDAHPLAQDEANGYSRGLLDFKTLFDASPNAAMVLDRSLRFVAANPAYVRTTGSASIESLLGRHVFEAFPNDPDNAEDPGVAVLRTSFERVLKDGVQDVVPLIAYRVDGADRFWSATHVPLANAAGETQYVLQLAVDVTELTQLQRQASASSSASSPSSEVQAGVLERAKQATVHNMSLRADRERLLRLFDHAPAFVAMLRGPEHIFELTNVAYQRLIGDVDVIGKSFAAALPEVVEQGLVRALDGVFTTGTPFLATGLKVELKTSATSSRTLTLDFSYQPIIEPDGSTSGIFVLGNDMTGLHELEQRNERLSEVVSQSSKCMAIADGSGTITYVNEAGRRLLGITDISGLTARAFFAPHDRSVYDDVIIPALLSGDEQWQGEVCFHNLATGVVVPVHHNTFVLRNKLGATIGTASIGRDLTAENAARQEREKLAEHATDARRIADSSERERRFLAESIPQQVWTADRKSVV